MSEKFLFPYCKSTTSGMVRNYVASRRCFGYRSKVLSAKYNPTVWRFYSKAEP
jgi:hypothetical protein